MVLTPGHCASAGGKLDLFVCVFLLRTLCAFGCMQRSMQYMHAGVHMPTIHPKKLYVRAQVLCIHIIYIIYICICMYVCMSLRMYLCVCLCVCARVCVCACVVCACIPAHACVCVCASCRCV